MNLFDPPIKSKKIRNGITAYQYRNGTININGAKFLGYSFTEAVNLWRKSNPAKK